MKKIYVASLALLLSSNLASSMQNSLKLLMETQTPQKILKTISPHVHFSSSKSQNKDEEEYGIPTTDAAFKKLMTIEKNDSVVQGLLQSLLPNLKIFSLNPKETSLPINDRKYVFMDFYAVDHNGHHYIMETQAQRHKYFDERALFYTTHTYATQLSQKDFEKNEWYLNLKPIISLQFLDYDSSRLHNLKNSFSDDPSVKRQKENPIQSGQYKKIFLLQDKESGQIIDHLQMHQFELPRISITLDDLKNNPDQEKWTLSLFKGIIKNQEDLNKLKNTPDYFQEALKRLRKRDWSPKVIAEYDKQSVDREKYDLAFNVSHNEGIKKGKLEVLKQLFQKGKLSQTEFDEESKKLS